MSSTRAIRISFLGAALLASAAGQDKGLRGLYRSSVVGTDFDFIQEGDPDAFDRLESRGEGLPEMPDKRGGAPLRQKAFLFVAHFKDGTSVLGVDRVVVHKGGEDTTAFSDVGLMVLYSENATKRISRPDHEGHPGPDRVRRPAAPEEEAAPVPGGAEGRAHRGDRA